MQNLFCRKIVLILLIGVLNEICAQDINPYELSLEELMSTKVVTASNTEENLSDAPTFTIVLTKEDVRIRGYVDLVEVLYDLPGIRSAGAGNTPGYWNDGLWFGSRGWINLFLPKPGRSLFVALLFNIDEK